MRRRHWARQALRGHTIAGLGILGMMFRGTCVIAQRSTSSPASDSLEVSDSVRDQHMVHVSPNRLLFDDHTHRATLTLSNTGDRATQADVLVYFAYTMSPHGLPADTILVTSHWREISPRDTVVLEPKFTDRSATHWITGLPTHVTLAARTAKQVSVQLTPPSSLPAGVYWARVVVEVKPPTTQKPSTPKDTRTIYRLPVKGNAPPTLRDSTLVFYRHGHVTMGLALGTVAVRYTPHDAQEVIQSSVPRLWFRIPLKLTGNAPFDGVLHATMENVQTGRILGEDNARLVVYHNQIFHWWIWSSRPWPAGRYRLILWFDSPQDEVPETLRLPAKLVADTVFVDVPAIP